MKNELFEKVLEEVKYPIPMKPAPGSLDLRDLPRVAEVVHLDGDSGGCIWVADRESARNLREYEFVIVTDPMILKKQKSYLDNKELCRKYPFWLDS